MEIQPGKFIQRLDPIFLHAILILLILMIGTNDANGFIQISKSGDTIQTKE